MTEATHSEIRIFIHQVEEAIKGWTSPDNTVRIEMSRELAELFLEYLRHLDPDMAKVWRKLLPQPLLPMLGPIVGDQMMNTKLHRLDELIERAGVMATLMTGLAIQLERMVERRAG